jgi:hypothetical protein
MGVCQSLYKTLSVSVLSTNCSAQSLTAWQSECVGSPAAMAHTALSDGTCDETALSNSRGLLGGLKLTVWRCRGHWLHVLGCLSGPPGMQTLSTRGSRPQYHTGCV